MVWRRRRRSTVKDQNADDPPSSAKPRKIPHNLGRWIVMCMLVWMLMRMLMRMLMLMCMLMWKLMVNDIKKKGKIPKSSLSKMNYINVLFSRVHVSLQPAMPVRWMVGWLIMLCLFGDYWWFLPHCSCQNTLLVFNITAPAHPHATWIAVYPALLILWNAAYLSECVCIQYYLYLRRDEQFRASWSRHWHHELRWGQKVACSPKRCCKQL